MPGVTSEEEDEERKAVNNMTTPATNGNSRKSKVGVSM
jgi:hypothetical protein